MSEEIEAPRPKSLTRVFHRERVEYWALIAEIVAATAVVLSLIFVGIQLRDANRFARSAAKNQTMEQYSEFRSSIYINPEAAELLLRGTQRPDELDEVERARVNLMLIEATMLAYQNYARYEAGLFEAREAEGGLNFALGYLCTPGGRDSLRGTLEANQFPGFTEWVRDYVPGFEEATGLDCGELPAV